MEDLKKAGDSKIKAQEKFQPHSLCGWTSLNHELEELPHEFEGHIGCATSESAFMLACTRPVGISYWPMQVSVKSTANSCIHTEYK